MRRLYEYVDIENAKFAERPLFSFLSDGSIDPLKRLLIAPCMAHFTMTFGDLNRFVYRQISGGTDIFSRVIYRHSLEDDHHWKWFLNDFGVLGFDEAIPFRDTLRFLWGPATEKTRQLAYEMSHLMLSGSPAERYALLRAVEANGVVIFTATQKPASDFEAASGRKLLFYGEHHLRVETGHAVGEEAEALERELSAYELDEATLERCKRVVHRVYEVFGAYVDELHAFASRHEPSGLPAILA